MNEKLTKILSAALSTALIIGCAGAGAAYAVNSNKEEAVAEETTVTAASQAEPSEITKDETVYVLAGADGSVQKIIVSDWIKNAVGSTSVSDKSELLDVENVKGDETYTMNGDNMRVWDTKGNDIYYQGNIEKELPVNLSVSYKLDGNSISPSELAGKSGKVTIRFDYTNNQYETVSINGVNEKIYVPFAMLTGMMLDNSVFSNVEVSNGKLLNDGDRTFAAGIALPGLQSNLQLKDDTLEIPDYVEITADVKDFEMANTVTIAINDIFSKVDTDKLSSLDGLQSSLNEMTDAMSQLIDGSSKLYGGLCTLLDKSGELIDGIDRLAEGSKALKNGAGDLYNGASDLQAGASQLYAGLNELASNNGALNGGATQVFESLLSMAEKQLAAAGLTVPALTVNNYTEVLNGVIASLDKNAVYEKALATVTSAVEGNRAYITEQVTSAVKAEVTAKVTAAVQEQVKAQVTEAVREDVTSKVILAATKLDKASYDAAVSAGAIDANTQTAINNQIDAQMQSAEVLQIIESKTAEQMATDGVKAIINEKVNAQMQSDDIKALIAQNTELQVQKAIADNMASEAVQSQLTAASEGAKSVIALKASLDSYNSFYIGLQTYTAGVAEAKDGAGKLKNGTDALKSGAGRLYDGATELYNGILTLKNGAPALTDGVTQLRDGSLKLSDGLKEFNEKGVEKLVEAVDGNISGLLTRVKATVDVSKDYKSFSGISDEMNGQVKFIYRTAAIEIK